MNGLPLSIVVALVGGAAVTLQERLDLYDPLRGAYLGSSITDHAPDGRRLRWEERDANGEPTLLFFVIHDVDGEESSAIFSEDGGETISREVFTYEEDGRVQRVTYFYEPGVAADQTRIERDASGRELRKQYFRQDGTQYGEEDVLWNEDGSARGWDFRYVEREGSASFRYEVTYRHDDGEWRQRLRSRDGAPERIEVRSLAIAGAERSRLTPVRFSPATISTEASETSPSFTHDGQTMVFARYDDDWRKKSAYIARLREDGWSVQALSSIGEVYNLAISPSGDAILFSAGDGDSRRMYRIRAQRTGWGAPEDLSQAYGIVGAYPCLTTNGDLLYFDANGSEGSGIYRAAAIPSGFARPVPLFAPDTDAPFDVFATRSDGPLLLTRCFDDDCGSDTVNGIWRVDPRRGGEAEHLSAFPYAWGIQPVESLGIVVFTDGEDILALPLVAVRESLEGF